jgi:cell division septation protein DedD
VGLIAARRALASLFGGNNFASSGINDGEAVLAHARATVSPEPIPAATQLAAPVSPPPSTPAGDRGNALIP